MQNISDEDPAFYNLAASIYYSNDDTSMAMSYINKAIVMQPDEAGYYLFKGVILEKNYSESLRFNRDKSNEFYHTPLSTPRKRPISCIDSSNQYKIYNSRRKRRPSCPYIFIP